MRAMWSGAISFGLVNIPVRLYKGTDNPRIDLDMLRRQDKCRIRYVRVCEETGEEVPYEDIVKGYEYEEGRYVIVEEEDFERARASITRGDALEVVSFVAEEEIDPIYFDEPYYLEPDAQAKRPYALLRQALKKSGKVGITRFVLRSRESLGMLKAEGDLITLVRLRFASQIRDPAELNLGGDLEVGERELEMAMRLVEQLSTPWHPEEFQDTYATELKRVIAAKVEGRLEEVEREEPIPTEVADLFSQLSRSLEMAQKGS